jgi:DNA-binding transcriptional MerR regulator
MVKSPDAFRTISEVADWLGVQAHVLRFWESKFSQVKPIKRAGGRRYYRPTDMLLLGGIKKLLHEDGLTIKGAQKLLREHGTAYVADLSQPLDDLTIAVIEGTAEEVVTEDTGSDTVTAAVVAPEAEAPAVDEDAQQAEPVEAAGDEPGPRAAEPVAQDEQVTEDASTADIETTAEGALDDILGDGIVDPDEDVEAPAEDDADAAIPTFRARSRDAMAPDPSDQSSPEVNAVEPTDDAPEPAEDAPEPAAAEEAAGHATEPVPQKARRPRVIDLGPLPVLDDFPDTPSVLSSLSHARRISAADAATIRPLLARLTRLRASMASPRKDLGKD